MMSNKRQLEKEGKPSKSVSAFDGGRHKDGPCFVFAVQTIQLGHTPPSISYAKSLPYPGSGPEKAGLETDCLLSEISFG